MDDVENLYKSGRGIVLHFSDTWEPRLIPVEKDVYMDVAYYNFNARCIDFDGFEAEYLVTLYGNSESVGYYAFSVPFGAHGPFFVTLTPTSPDYSGTMDKTVAEINAAYAAGQEIIARVVLSATSYVDSPLHTVVHDDSTYPSFEGYVIQSGTNVLVYCHTNSTNDGTTATYFTTVYSLTPAS